MIFRFEASTQIFDLHIENLNAFRPDQHGVAPDQRTNAHGAVIALSMLPIDKGLEFAAVN
jgi:hypothetical protein